MSFVQSIDLQAVYKGFNKGRELVMTRGYGKNPHNGEALQGQWVVYDFNTGEFIDNSPFRNDLIEKWFE